MGTCQSRSLLYYGSMALKQIFSHWWLTIFPSHRLNHMMKNTSSMTSSINMTSPLTCQTTITLGFPLPSIISIGTSPCLFLIIWKDIYTSSNTSSQKFHTYCTAFMHNPEMEPRYNMTMSHLNPAVSDQNNWTSFKNIGNIVILWY